VYRLWIRLSKRAAVRVGALGRYDLPTGTYVYVGSAKVGLRARLARHRSRAKTVRWHVDYLLDLPHVRIERIEVRPWRRGEECRWAKQTRAEGGQILVHGFGASDCRARCGAHLFFIPASSTGGNRPPVRAAGDREVRRSARQGDRPVNGPFHNRRR